MQILSSLYVFIGKSVFLPVSSIQLSLVIQSCPTLCDPMDCSTPGFPVHHQLLELALTHVHWVSDAIQPSHPLSSPSPTFSHSQLQGLFQWFISSHQVVKILEFQLQFFQWIFRTDFLYTFRIWELFFPPKRYFWSEVLFYHCY